MSWTTPPTFVVGAVLTAAQQNALSGDLTLLADQVGLTGAGAAIYGGTPPAAGSPLYSMQGGSLVASADTNGHMLIIFPNSFPAGLLEVQLTMGINGYGCNFDDGAGGTNSYCYVTIYTLSTGVHVGAGGLYRVNWHAIGW